MKLSISRKSLVTALATAKAASLKTNMPILKHTLLQVEDSTAFVTCTDLDTFIRVELDAEDAEDGQTTCSTELLHNIAKSFPEGPEGEETIITLETDDKGITIDSGSSKYRLGTLDPAEYPAWPTMAKTDTKLTMPQSQLRELLCSVTHANENVDASRYILTGVLFKLDKTNFTVVATDGRCLAVMSAPFGSPIGSSVTLVVPGDAVRILLPHLTTEEDANITIIIGDTRIYFKLASAAGTNVEIISKLIEGQYPNYTQVIPESEVKHGIVSRLELLTNLKRLKYISEITSFQFAKQTLTLKAQSTQQDSPGDATEVISLTTPYTGVTKANGRYFIAMLSAVLDDEVTIQITDPEAPIVLEGVDKPWKFVVMPMRDPVVPKEDPKATAAEPVAAGEDDDENDAAAEIPHPKTCGHPNCVLAKK